MALVHAVPAFVVAYNSHRPAHQARRLRSVRDRTPSLRFNLRVSLVALLSEAFAAQSQLCSPIVLDAVQARCSDESAMGIVDSNDRHEGKKRVVIIRQDVVWRLDSSTRSIWPILADVPHLGGDIRLASARPANCLLHPLLQKRLRQCCAEYTYIAI